MPHVHTCNLNLVVTVLFYIIFICLYLKQFVKMKVLYLCPEMRETLVLLSCSIMFNAPVLLTYLYKP